MKVRMDKGDEQICIYFETFKDAMRFHNAMFKLFKIRGSLSVPEIKALMLTMPDRCYSVLDAYFTDKDNEYYWSNLFNTKVERCHKEVGYKVVLPAVSSIKIEEEKEN